jgi:hypothetical protein
MGCTTARAKAKTSSSPLKIELAPTSDADSPCTVLDKAEN